MIAKLFYFLFLNNNNYYFETGTAFHGIVNSFISFEKFIKMLHIRNVNNSWCRYYYSQHRFIFILFIFIVDNVLYHSVSS